MYMPIALLYGNGCGLIEKVWVGKSRPLFQLELSYCDDMDMIHVILAYMGQFFDYDLRFLLVEV